MRLADRPAPGAAVALCVALTLWPAMGRSAALSNAPPCVAGKTPMLSIDLYDDLSLPVEDAWQVLFNEVPISDAQLAWWSDDDALLHEIRTELDHRGPLVFAGMIAAGTGAAVSSVGWALVGGAGNNHLSNGTTLSLALGGVLLGIAGILVTGDFVQTPLEPFLAPTPKHRVTRERAQELVNRVNQRMAHRACAEPPTPAAVP